jgi:hypothetical protein
MIAGERVYGFPDDLEVKRKKVGVFDSEQGIIARKRKL